jgi:hypothetical protein
MSTIEEMRPILKAVFTTKYPTLKERTDIIEA